MWLEADILIWPLQSIFRGPGVMLNKVNTLAEQLRAVATLPGKGCDRPGSARHQSWPFLTPVGAICT